MAKGLAALGLEVTVASTDADGVSRLDVPLDRPVFRDGATYRFFPRSWPGEWKYPVPWGGGFEST